LSWQRWDKMAGMRRIFLAWLLVIWTGQAQTPGLKERTDAFFQERGRLQKEAGTLFEREMAREKAGDCPNALVTREINDCVGKEVETSTANYQVYAASLRAMLVQKNPWGENENAAAGPTGKPLTRQEMVKDFDQMEAAWGKYRESMCTWAFGLYKSGSIAHSVSYNCELMMLRSHMRELRNVYGEYLSH
jgi:hypothetical protein